MITGNGRKLGCRMCQFATGAAPHTRLFNVLLVGGAIIGRPPTSPRPTTREHEEGGAEALPTTLGKKSTLRLLYDYPKTTTPAKLLRHNYKQAVDRVPGSVERRVSVSADGEASSRKVRRTCLTLERE